MQERWWRQQLPFDDELHPLYIAPSMRAMWVVLWGAVVGTVKYLELGAKTLPEGLALIASTPIVVAAVLRVVWPGERRRRALGPTKPGRAGPDTITGTLRAIHDLISSPDDHAAGLRVTLFSPDVPAGLLRQLARYSRSTTNVSRTAVRMGTGDVGRAFTWNKTTHIHDVKQDGGFVACMQGLGLESWEIDAHSDKSRSSFYAVPLYDPQVRKRFGVLSLDAREPRFFVRKKQELAHALRLCNQLLEQLVTMEVSGVTMPDTTQTAEGSQGRSDDSNPQIRVPTGPNQVVEVPAAGDAAAPREESAS